MIAILTCRNCGEEFSADEEFFDSLSCPHCGACGFNRIGSRL